MGHGPFTASERTIRAALAGEAYRDGRFRLVESDLSGCDCLATTRAGLFGVGRGGVVRLLAHGFFFGIRRHGAHLYLFEACDRVDAPTDRGRLVRLSLAGRRLGEPEILATGLHNRCHQIAIVNGLLCVVDTAAQAIRRFTLAGEPIDTQQPFPPAPASDRSGAYVHLNAIAAGAGGAWLLLHNGAAEPSRPSELAWCDVDWRVRRRVPLAGHGCHDIVPDEAGLLWHCASMTGEIINAAGFRLKVSDRMTRGLALLPDRILVGTSPFARRSERDRITGSVLILDRVTWHVEKIDLPAAPMELMSL